MSDTFGFDKAKAGAGEGEALPLARKALPAIEVDPARERDALARGAELGFVDRGQGRLKRRERGGSGATDHIFIKGPVEVLQWFIAYTEQSGHGAYWKSLEDMRNLIERRG